MDQELSRLLKVTAALAKVHLGPLLSAPKDIFLSAQLDQLYDDAQKLDTAGKKSEALSKYLEIFERSRNCGGWGGVRLSYLLSNIACMNYPPALKALYAIRQHRECQMLAGIFNWDEIHEWASVNHFLSDNHILKFYDELSWLDLDVYDICAAIRFVAINDFINSKRYEDFSRSDLERSLLFLKTMTEDFGPGKVLAKLPRTLSESIKGVTVKQNSLWFEVAVATGEEKIANNFVRLLTEYVPEAETFIVLNKCAKHEGKSNWIKEIDSKAAKSLPTDEYRKFQKG